MSKIEVDAIEPQSGTSLTVGASGDTVTVPSGVTFDASNSTLTLPDGSVSLAKLSATGTKDATTFLRGDNSFAVAGGGKVLQVIQTVKTDTSSISSSSFVDFSISASITPASASNKILAIASLDIGGVPGGRGGVRILRGGTDILLADSAGSRIRASVIVTPVDNTSNLSTNITYLDSPSSTSATTYKIQASAEGGNTLYLNRTNTDTDASNYYRGTSTLTLMEISA
jgi:hypothetical protein